MNQEKHFQTIAEELGVRISQVEKTVELLDTENTVPFIARYRKEVTGNLNEEQIDILRDIFTGLIEVEKRINQIKRESGLPNLEADIEIKH